MLGIQFKWDPLEELKSEHICARSEDCFDEKFFSQRKKSDKQKRQEHEEHCLGEVHAGELADDDRDTGRTVIDRIIRKQDARDRKRRHKRAENDHQQ